MGQAPSAASWTAGLGPAGGAALSAAVALILVPAAGAWAFIQLLRQHGRLLVR